MYDINFFESYLPKPKKTNYLLLFAILILLLFIGAIGFFEYQHYLKKTELEKKIEEFESQYNSSKVSDELSKFADKKIMQQTLGSTLAKLDVVDQYLDYKKVVYSGLLSEISRSVPDKVFIAEIQIEEHTVVISGFAESYKAIAQFQHQLRSVESLGYVFAPEMQESESNYSFSLAAAIRSEDENEGE